MNRFRFLLMMALTSFAVGSLLSHSLPTALTLTAENTLFAWIFLHLGCFRIERFQRRRQKI